MHSTSPIRVSVHCTAPILVCRAQGISTAVTSTVGSTRIGAAHLHSCIGALHLVHSSIGAGYVRGRHINGPLLRENGYRTSVHFSMGALHLVQTRIGAVYVHCRHINGRPLRQNRCIAPHSLQYRCIVPRPLQYRCIIPRPLQYRCIRSPPWDRGRPSCGRGRSS